MKREKKSLGYAVQRQAHSRTAKANTLGGDLNPIEPDEIQRLLHDDAKHRKRCPSQREGILGPGGGLANAEAN